MAKAMDSLARRAPVGLAAAGNIHLNENKNADAVLG